MVQIPFTPPTPMPLRGGGLNGVPMFYNATFHPVQGFMPGIGNVNSQAQVQGPVPAQMQGVGSTPEAMFRTMSEGVDGIGGGGGYQGGYNEGYGTQ